MTRATYNINGWTENNYILRTQIFRKLNYDIYCLNETHLDGFQNICVIGYKWFGYNRAIRHTNAPRMFGGVGFLLKAQFCQAYNIKVIDKCVDGIMGMYFQDNYSNYSFAIFSCYLPPEPEGSPYANANNFLNHLSSQLYIFNDADVIIIFNRRIGKMSDVIECDDLPDRKYIDEVVHGHGDSLIDFLIDNKMCVLNGRFAFEEDNFTCISGRGKSVVDYITTPHYCLSKCFNFKVLTSSEVINQFDLHGLISNRCKPPDHSIVACSFQTMHTSLYNELQLSDFDNTNNHVLFVQIYV